MACETNSLFRVLGLPLCKVWVLNIMEACNPPLCNYGTAQLQGKNCVARFRAGVKLFNNKKDAFYSNFCFIDIVSFINGVLSSRVSAHSKTTWVAKSQQASC